MLMCQRHACGTGCIVYEWDMCIHWFSMTSYNLNNGKIFEMPEIYGKIEENAYSSESEWK